MPNSVPLNQKLVLFDFLLREFGFSKFDDLRGKFHDMELDHTVPGNSLFYQNLASSVRFPTDKLRQYDENLISHLAVVNIARKEPIRLKYYQYFSLLFTEYYLDQYFADRHDLVDKLNRHMASSQQEAIKNLPAYTENELNKVAYWNATGSGKTFITHINVLQLRHYQKEHRKSFRNLLLLTPSEDMSKQHLDELLGSNITGNYYWEDRQSKHVKVIDIHKIREFSKGDGVTVPLAEFDRDNAIFVDEGHKGDSKEDSQWRNVRTTLSEQGFAFEYSATFGQIKDEGLQQEYAKCIIFDYSYGNFFRDGYGKDYWIHNLTDDKLIEGNHERRYLLQNLLLFLQQKLYYRKYRDELQAYRIQDPLLIFVGTSVEPKAKGNQLQENQEVISDVKKVIDFFNEMIAKKSTYVKWIDDLREKKQAALFRQDYLPKFEYLFGQFRNSEEIYDACLKILFHSSSPDSIEFHSLRNAEGEIGVKVKNADQYFALIYIGDTSSFRTPLEAEYEFKKDVTTASLFHSLSDSQKNPVNILIGARKFIEGWNNYRVSSIGLINFGRSKGSQIIQLFGRGVRLFGKDNSLKRSAKQANAPKFLEAVETLNVFGLRADYMRRFKDDLEREGIKTSKREYTFEVSVRDDLHALKLYTLEKDYTKPAFADTNVFALAYEPSIKVRLDLAPKKFLVQAGTAGVVDDVETVSFKLADRELDLVDWQEIYLKLISFKYDRRYTNLQIQRDEIRSLMKKINYEIISDNHFAVSSFSDVERMQRIILAVLKRYTESFYKRNVQNYEGKHLKSAILDKNNSNLAEAGWQVEVVTTDLNGIELQGIQSVLQEIDKLTSSSPDYPKAFKGNNFLLNSWLKEHLYQPLLNDDSNKKNLQISGVSLIDRMKPIGLNSGEEEFVKDLGNFVGGQSANYPDYEFYLLRNMGRGVGFGFYFMAGGFYPDFMLWIKHNTNGKQYLSFIDPHGLRNEPNGWNSDKIMLHETIKEIERQIGNSKLVLSSFILQPPPGFLGALIDRWSRDDDAQKQMDLHLYAASRNVFEIPTMGNKSGRNGYVDLMVQRILGVSQNV